MNKISVLCFVLLISLNIYANGFEPAKPHIPTHKEQKEFDKMLSDRLQLTEEQKNYLKANRQKHFKEMQRTVSKMEALHKKIKNVYLLGIPKYQADIRTAGYKAELALLKQNAQKQKAESRKNFESILTKEQKIELEKMRKERIRQRMPKPPEEQ